MMVTVHDMQELGEGRRAVIVTRKNMLLDEFWNNIKVGDKVSGRVSSIPSFGVFLDLGGVEGLIHVSRLSQVRVDSPASVARKGEIMEAVVVELDREKNRIALSRKELEESPWKNAETEFAVGSRHKGIVRRLTDFGAYVELKPGIDGLLRNSEISWTKRVKKPADVFKPGTEIECEIVSFNAEKEALSLSFKRTTPNPWNELLEKYPVDSEYNGLVVQVMPQGAIIEINDELDGFMPRSKMRNVLKGKRIPYQTGERISVKIADIVPAEESLILTPAEAEEPSSSSKTGDGFRGQRQRPPKDNGPKIKISAPTITLVDLLSEAERKDLFKTMD
jgi:small subunit ribosomal protein S1